MHYNVTIVELAMSGHRYIIGAHRAAVEHLLHAPLARGTMLVVGDGTLCMPESPMTLAELWLDHDIDKKILAEALEIDEAMRSKSEAANV